MRRELDYYRTKENFAPFIDWLLSLKDQKGMLIIKARLNRLKTGNFGDTKYLGHGLYELRIHYGPGYRLYFSKMGLTTILVIMAGTKTTQKKDIPTAKSYLKKN